MDIFNNALKTTWFTSKCWYLRKYGHKAIFSKWSQKTFFLSICWYFRIYWQKTTFLKRSPNNVIIVEMLIFMDLWTKNYGFKMFSKQTKILIYTKIRTKYDFFLNDLKNIFKSALKKPAFCQTVYIFECISKNRTFFKIILKKRFFESDLK